MTCNWDRNVNTFGDLKPEDYWTIDLANGKDEKGNDIYTDDNGMVLKYIPWTTKVMLDNKMVDFVIMYKPYNPKTESPPERTMENTISNIVFDGLKIHFKDNKKTDNWKLIFETDRVTGDHTVPKNFNPIWSEEYVAEKDYHIHSPFAIRRTKTMKENMDLVIITINGMPINMVEYSEVPDALELQRKIYKGDIVMLHFMPEIGSCKNLDFSQKENQ